MRLQPNYRIDGFEYILVEGAPGSAKGAVQRKIMSHRGTMGKQVAACLIGTLLLLFGMLALPARSFAEVSVGVSVNFGPPPIPVYVQPDCPGPGYMWTPGYWAWDPGSGYYWVPGTWVAAPFAGAMWTPGYWGYRHGLYVWFGGYWGPAVGFYGGINYGYGYTGYGYHGGYWDHDRFFYNRAVNNIHNTYITNVYNQRVVENNRFSRVSYNGGPGGINARATRAQFDAARGRRFGPVRDQMRQEHFARMDPMQRASFNHGRPSIAATRRPGAFRDNSIVRASRAGGPYREPARRMNGNRGSERGPSGNTARYSAGRGRVERGGPARGNAGRPARAQGYKRGPYQARAGGQHGPENHAAAERHGAAPHQEKDNGGNGHGHGRGGHN
jgi:WXXGXW repeat (2 copies)